METYGRKHSKLYPREDEARAKVDGMMTYDADDIYPAVTAFVVGRGFLVLRLFRCSLEQ